MFTLSRRQTSFPHHWPIHVAGLQSLGMHGPGTHLTGEAGEAGEISPAACQPPPGPSNGGGLAAAPWLGLHYAIEIA